MPSIPLRPRSLLYLIAVYQRLGWASPRCIARSIAGTTLHVRACHPAITTSAANLPPTNWNDELLHLRLEHNPGAVTP